MDFSRSGLWGKDSSVVTLFEKRSQEALLREWDDMTGRGRKPIKGELLGYLSTGASGLNLTGKLRGGKGR